MRAVYIVIGLGACGFTATSGQAELPPDAPVNGKVVCDGNQCRLRLDTDAELGAATVMDQIGVEPDVAMPADPNRAVLTSAAYLPGAVIARGSDAPHGTIAAGVDWAGIDAATVSGISYAFTDLAGLPVRVGITDNADWSYWIEGELQLAPGMVDLEIRGDDIASLQIAPRGTRAYATVAASTQNSTSVVTFDAGTGGWFPFRAAAVQTNGGGSGLAIRVGPVGGALTAIPRPMVRGRVDDLRGMFVVAWDDQLMGGPMTPNLYTRDVLDDPITNPRAFGLTSNDDLSQRWFGQLRVVTPGTYQLSASSDDGNRLFLADQASADNLTMFGSNIQSSVTATNLRAGWHDLVVDYNQGSGGSTIKVGQTQPAVVAKIPARLLRPVMPRDQVLVSHEVNTSQAIPNNNATGLTLTFTPGGLPGEVIREVRLGYQITHNAINEVEIDLTYKGVTADARNKGDNNVNNRFYRATQFNGMPLDGTFTVRVADDTGGQSGTLGRWNLSIITQSGPGPLATRSEWISTIKDLGTEGRVLSLDQLDAGVVLPPGATAELFVRACAAMDGCDGAWTGPLTSGQPIAGVSATQYAQFRVVLTSDGMAEPALDFLELAYRVEP